MAEDGTVDLTPMLDVVFILLIFFVVTATFLNETAVSLVVPDGEGGEPASRPVLVSVSATDQCAVASREVSCASVADATEVAVAQSVMDGEGQSVVLRIDVQSRHATMVEVKSALDAAGFDPVLEPTRTAS